MGEAERGAFDAWGTINALAARTTSLRLGTMVSPTSFRHPSVLAKLVTTADHVSNGRIELGMGTGWSEIEHTAMGFDFHSMKERMDVLEEQLDDRARRALQGRTVQLRGRALHDPGPHVAAVADPAPAPAADPGGNAGPRAARLAARFADEYNTVMPTLDEVRERRANIAAACEKAGREPIPFSVMTTAVIGADEAE